MKKRSLDFKNGLITLIKKDFSQIANSFQVYNSIEDHSNPKAYPFLISTETGFLPRTDPILKLPNKYEILNVLLNKMRWNQPDGSQGLLAKKQFGQALRRELPLLDIDGTEDTMLDLALLRDYSFLASAYLLEECHHNYLQSGNYGLGRDCLPSVIAKPFVKLANKLKLRPFMEYNSCYALNNWYKKDSENGISIDNIDVYRSFINMKSEVGFISVHVAINQHSGRLIKIAMDVFNFCELKDTLKFNQSLGQMRDVMMSINQEFNRMYYESNSQDYNIFRTFLFGILNQPMFPNGVVYEGCFDNRPQFFRGGTGANDSIIPLCDNILQITQFLPHNPITDILRDFRTYRPQSHIDFLSWIEETSKKIGVLEFAKENPESMLHLLEVADQIRAFRHSHWAITNLYIMNYSKHPVATGGSPISTGLSNQLFTVIDFIKSHSKYVTRELSSLSSYFQYDINSILKRCEAGERIITREMEREREKIESVK